MSDIGLKLDDMIRDIASRAAKTQASALETYIVEWFKNSPDVNPSDVALKTWFEDGAFHYQMMVVTK